MKEKIIAINKWIWARTIPNGRYVVTLLILTNVWQCTRIDNLKAKIEEVDDLANYANSAGQSAKASADEISGRVEDLERKERYR